jgi:hypothetical protein
MRGVGRLTTRATTSAAGFAEGLATSLAGGLATTLTGGLASAATGDFISRGGELDFLLRWGC